MASHFIPNRRPASSVWTLTHDWFSKQEIVWCPYQGRGEYVSCTCTNDSSQLPGRGSLTFSGIFLHFKYPYSVLNRWPSGSRATSPRTELQPPAFLYGKTIGFFPPWKCSKRVSVSLSYDMNVLGERNLKYSACIDISIMCIHESESSIFFLLLSRQQQIRKETFCLF